MSYHAFGARPALRGYGAFGDSGDPVGTPSSIDWSSVGFTQKGGMDYVADQAVPFVNGVLPFWSAAKSEKHLHTELVLTPAVLGGNAAAEVNALRASGNALLLVKPNAAAGLMIVGTKVPDIVAALAKTGGGYAILETPRDIELVAQDIVAKGGSGGTPNGGGGGGTPVGGSCLSRGPCPDGKPSTPDAQGNCICAGTEPAWLASHWPALAVTGVAVAIFVATLSIRTPQYSANRRRR